MKKIIVFAAALMLGISAFAQETNRDEAGNLQYGPYETNKFWDNWFVDVNGGINMSLKGALGKHNGMGLDLSADLGKWLDPCYGIRAGYQGFTAGDIMTSNEAFGDIRFNYIHTDFMVNASNLFAGYKENRTISFVPYITAGFAFKQKMTEYRSIAYGVGLQMPIRLGSVVSIVPQAQLLGLRGIVFNSMKGGLSELFTASLGLQFNLGKNNWTRKATTLGGAAAAVAAAEAAQAALKASNDKLAAEANDALAALQKAQAENASLKKALEDALNAPKIEAVDLGEHPICAYFEIGKAVLSDKELAHFDYNVKSALSQCNGEKLNILGSADAKTGTKAGNEKLSKKRAEYLFNLLTEKYGLNPDCFTISNVVTNENPVPALNRVGVISK